MDVLSFPKKPSDQYLDYLLAQRFQLLQHIRLIDEVLREWNVALIHDEDTGRTTWHRTKEERHE